MKYPKKENIANSSLKQDTVLKLLNAYKKFVGLEDDSSLVLNEDILKIKKDYDEIENLKCIHNLYIVQYTSNDIEDNENYKFLKRELEKIKKDTGNEIKLYFINASIIQQLYDSV